MSRYVIGIVVVLLLAGLIPFGLIALGRAHPSAERPVHLILDMVRQPKFLPQRENRMFADDRAMRPLLPGVVARGDLSFPNRPMNQSPYLQMIDGRREPWVCADEASYERLFRGIRRPAGGKPAFLDEIPLPVNMDLMRRGQERFNIYCAPCHGEAGYGDGMVARRAAEMQASGANTAAGWVAPTNYHTADLRSRLVGSLYNTITNGIRTMPAYDKQIGILDRWAIVAYVKALQRSQDAKAADVPEIDREKYK
jgi:mono/diheme cytochrome c family protein